MDREQEDMQFLGVFGIYKEAYKIIFSWKKIFTKITLTLILPLTFIFLAHIEISHVIFKKIITNEEDLSETKEGTTKYKNLSDMISSEWTTLWLFKLVYFTFLLIFSLLSTSAVVYTIASIYTGRDVSFKKVMSVVPKVWKRLMVTFLCTFIAFFAYNVLTFLVIFLWAFTIGIRKGGIAIFVVIVILYIIGFVYLSIVWHLASVVTVLEDSYGIQAMLKSKELIKGKMGLALIITLKLSFSFFIVQFAFEKLVVHGWRLGMLERTAYGVICFILLCKLFLFGLVIQTVIYFVCKSYHHENIDKSALSDHLEVYLGDYVPLKAKDVQLEQFQV